MIATSSAQGALAWVSIVSYVAFIGLVIFAGLFLYYAIAVSSRRWQERQRQESRTTRNHARPVGPPRCRPGVVSPCDAKRSRA